MGSVGVAHARSAAQTQARRMERAGKVAYKKGDYAGAILAFRAANEAVPKSKHLYNLARCHEKLGELQEAVVHYERFLADVDDGEEHEDVRTLLEFLRLKLLNEEEGEDEPEEEQAGDEAEEEEAGDEAGEQGAEERVVPAAKPAAKPAAVPSRQTGFGAEAIVAFGVAAAALATGVVFGLMAKDEAAQLEAATSQRTSTRAEATGHADAANRAGLVANISLGLAAAAGVTGGVLVWTSGEGVGAGGAWVIRW